MKRFILFLSLLVLALSLSAQRPGGTISNPSPMFDSIYFYADNVDTIKIRGLAANPARNVIRPPSPGMILVAGSVKKNGAVRSYWIWPDDIGLGSPELTSADLTEIAGQVNIDATRLTQDSILIYSQGGSEIGRDTIAGVGGGSGGIAYTAGNNLTLTGTEFAAEVGQAEVDDARNAAQNYTDLRISEIDTTRIGNTVNANIVVYPDSITQRISNAPYRFSAKYPNGKSVYIENANVNYLEPGLTESTWLTGGTNGSSTRLLGTPSGDGSARNQITGVNALRMIHGGYDNSIGPVIASGIIQSHHSAIETTGSGGGHNTILGGSFHFINDAGYVGIAAGTDNRFETGGFSFIGGSRGDSLSGEFLADIASDGSRIEGDEFNVILASNDTRIYDGSLYNTVFSTFTGEVQGTYNVIAGLRAKAFGAGNAVFGGRNEVGTLGGTSRNYNVVGGTFHTVQGEHSAIFGQNIDMTSGGHSLLAGEDIVADGSFMLAVGELHNLSAGYTATWGRNNNVQSTYAWAGGRNNTISPGASYSSIISGVGLTNDRASTALAENIEVEGFYYDRRGEAGDNNDVLTKDAAGTDWKAPGDIVVTNPTGGTNTLQESLNDINNNISFNGDFGGQKGTNLAEGTLSTDAATYGQLLAATGGVGAMVKGASTANNTDASGDITITHGLGATPGQVFLTLNQTEAYRLSVHDINATTFKARVTDSNGAIVASTNVRFFWQAYQ